MSVEVKQAVTVTEMAKIVGLSRARFYQLIGSAFPYPLYSVSTRRPFFDEQLQKVCLEVRRRNCGIDGKPILFYSRRLDLPTPKKQINTFGSVRPKRPIAKHTSLIAGLAGLGLAGITDQQVEAALQKLYPQGTDGIDQSTLLRELFVGLMRRDRGDNVRR
jgi:hypothetical protein